MPPKLEKKIEEGKEGEGKRDIPIVRTLKTDSERFIQEKNISLIDIAAAKADKEGLKVQEQKRSWKNILFISFIIILLIGTGVSGFFIYKLKQKKSQGVVISPLPKPFLLTDKEEEVTLNGVKDKTQGFLSTKELLYLAIFREITDEQGKTTKRLVTINEFFDHFRIASSSGIIEPVEKKFMFVVFRSDKNWPVLIFKLKAYDNAFASMIKWEGTMANDLSEIFFIDKNQVSSFAFSDKEIENRDARLLYDSSGKPVLLYSFINKEYLIIASSEDALREIFRRFASPQYIND